jgi:hypothetical protein
MTWDDVLDKIRGAGLNAAEEIYIDNFGNSLPSEYPQFHGRFLRCARGVINCKGVRVEVYIFPSESQLQDFLDVIGGDPSWIAHQNVALHSPGSDSGVIDGILQAISDTKD